MRKERERYIRLAKEILKYFECERCGECCTTLPICSDWEDMPGNDSKNDRSLRQAERPIVRCRRGNKMPYHHRFIGPPRGAFELVAKEGEEKIDLN